MQKSFGGYGAQKGISGRGNGAELELEARQHSGSTGVRRAGQGRRWLMKSPVYPANACIFS